MKYVKCICYLVIPALIITLYASSPALAAGSATGTPEAISYSEKTVTISTGKKAVKVITVDPQSPGISFEVNTPGSKLNTTADFEAQIKAKKPFAAVNANFFEAYSEVKDPIGHIMSNGKLLFAQSGITSLGITSNKAMIFSVPGIFIRMFSDGKRTNDMRRDGTAFYNKWTAYELNTRSTSDNTAVMYTPARGKSITIKSAGSVATVINGELQSFSSIAPPATVNIPSNGYVTFFGKKIVDSWKGDNGLFPGRKIEVEYTLFSNTNPEFKIEDMQWILSGGPDLVKGGKLAPASTNPIFKGERFTTLSTSRTAIGLTKNNRLIIVYTSAKISELRQIMLALGCKDAINLDGGASSAMYYNGKVLVKPGRKLATVLYIYKAE